MSVKSRRRAAKSQATTAAALQYMPQALALSQLLRSTASDYQSQVAQTRSYAASVRAGALSQVNPLRAALQPILDQQRQDQADSAARLAAIGPGASNYAASAAREAQAANSRLSGTQAGAVTELNSRAADALSGGQFATQNLTSKYNLDKQKIMDQIAGLAQQKGLYTAKAYQDTLQSLRSQDITLRGQGLTAKNQAATRSETHRHNVATESQAAANAQKKKGAKKLLAPGDQQKTRSKIDQVVSVIQSSPTRDANGRPLNDHAIRQHLMSGQNPLKKPIEKPLVNVAMDLARLGYVSVPNRRYLHSLGFKVPKDWIAKPATPRSAARAVGGTLGQIFG